MATTSNALVRVGTGTALAFAGAAALGIINAQPAHAATATAISTPADLKAMEKNHKGSYYLANDIDLSGEKDFKLFTISSFQGTLDGKGHVIKNFTRTETSKYGNKSVALIERAYGATIKNLKMTGVNITINSNKSIECASLVKKAEKCTFDSITTSGNIKITSGNGADEEYGCSVGGMFWTLDSKSAVNKCTNNVNISVSCKDVAQAKAGGIAYGDGGKFTKCTNKGDVDIKGSGQWTANITACGLVAGNLDNPSLTSCTNSGKITASLSPSSAGGDLEDVVVTGLAPSAKVASCGNTGAVKLVMGKGTEATNIRVAGLFGWIGGADSSSKLFPIKNCYNKGSVTFDGSKWSMGSTHSVDTGGVVGYAYGMGKTKTVTQCYNKGAIKATINKNGSNLINVGGVCGEWGGGTFCSNYNVGSLTGKGNMFIGGIIGWASMMGKPSEGVVIEKNYSTGKVKLSGTKSNYRYLKPGSLIGYYEDSDVARTRNIYNNYYTSGKPYPQAGLTWHEWRAKATKVSSITFGNCPKLSSKIWTYSGKHKRLVLKANKE